MTRISELEERTTGLIKSNRERLYIGGAGKPHRDL